MFDKIKKVRIEVNRYANIGFVAGTAQLTLSYSVSVFTLLFLCASNIGLLGWVLLPSALYGLDISVGLQRSHVQQGLPETALLPFRGGSL